MVTKHIAPGVYSQSTFLPVHSHEEPNENLQIQASMQVACRLPCEKTFKIFYIVQHSRESHHIVTEEDEGSPAYNLSVDHG